MSRPLVCSESLSVQTRMRTHTHTHTHLLTAFFSDEPVLAGCYLYFLSDVVLKGNLWMDIIGANFLQA